MSDEKSELYQRAGEHFDALCDLPTAEQEEQLRRLAVQDPAVAALVERLLEADQAPLDQLDTSGGWSGIGFEEVFQHSDPERVGDYRILRRIGAGGMGVVFEAEHLQLGRRVALKLLRPSLLDQELLLRFKHEAKMLSWLNHPGIAQIYEAGTDQSGEVVTPFLAMELVDGRPLLDAAAEDHLALRSQVELLASIADAVHHAHQKGVIHRDLKPANILVDRSGQPKVLDFGVARATDGDRLATSAARTRTGNLVGTLAYMSPEQVKGQPGDIDVRSDVYSLGVIAHELLSGRRLYPAEDQRMHEIARRIAEEEPPRLGAVSSPLRGDLETIVGKALEKDRERRYASAEDLGRDLRRYLQDQPILARPPSGAYQLRKFARRNQALVAGVFAVLVTLVAGGITSTVLYFQSRRSERSAEQSAARAETKAETALRVQEYLVDLFRLPIPEEEWGLALNARDLLDRGASRIGELEDEPALRAELLDTMGRAYLNLGAYDRGGPLLSQAVQLREAAGQQGTEEWGRSVRSLAALQTATARNEEAESMLRSVLDRMRGGHPGDHEEVAASLSALAAHLASVGQFPEARSHLDEALAMRRRLHGERHPSVADTLRIQGRLQLVAGELAASRELLEEVLAIRQQQLDPNHPAVIESLLDLSEVLSADKQYRVAEPHLREVLTLYEEYLDEDHPARIRATQLLADNLQLKGDDEQALELHQRVLELCRKRFGEDSLVTASAKAEVAGMLVNYQARLDQAEKLYREVLATKRALVGDRHPSTLVTLKNLALLVAQWRGDSDEAETLLKETLELVEEIHGEFSLSASVVHNHLGVTYRARRHWEPAREHTVQALEILQQHYPGDHPDVARSLHNVGGVFFYEEEFEAAEPYLIAALEMQERLFPEGHPNISHGMEGLGSCYLEMGELELAEPLLLDALAIREEHFPADHRSVLEARFAVGRCHRELGDYQTAEQEMLSAHDAMRAKLGKDHHYIYEMMKELVELYEAWERPQELHRWRTELNAATLRRKPPVNRD